MQVSPRPSRGRTLRLSLVRTETEYFLSKLSSPSYLKLRTVPLERKYRFIISDFTHEEYENFKSDFIEEIDFLRLSDVSFQSLVGVASGNEIFLSGFESRGAGRVSFNSRDTGWDHWELYKEMKREADRGIKPFFLQFQKDDTQISLRKDLNFFVSKIDREAARWINFLSTEIMKNYRASFEELSNFKIKRKTDRESNPQMLSIVFTGQFNDFRGIISNIESEFSLKYVRKDPVNPEILIQDKRLPESFIRLDFRFPYLIAVPSLRTNLESSLALMDIVLSNGGTRVA